MTSLVIGQLYDATRFSSITTTYHDFLTFQATNGVPELVFQPKNTDTVVKHAIVSESNPSTCYVIQKDDKYMFLGFSNVSTLAFIFIDNTFKTWITSNNFQHVFEQPISLTGLVDTYNYLYVTFNPSSILSNYKLIYLTESNPNYLHTTKFWTVPNVSDISNYMSSFTDYDIKLYKDSPVWYTPVVKDGIADYHLTFVPPPVLEEGTANITTSTNAVNLIYTKSLYESSLSYFDATYTRLHQELQEEEALNQVLQTNDAQLINELQTFIDTKQPEVEAKVAAITTLHSQIQTIVTVNKELTHQNNDLHTLLESQPAKDLSDKILELRDTTYASLKFLTDNNRFGTNQDLVYIVNKVRI